MGAPSMAAPCTSKKTATSITKTLLYIARRHTELEDEAAAQAHGVLFCDTNAATTALYSYY